MRKLFLFILFPLIIIAIGDVYGQTKSLKSGYSINLITGFPSAKNYGLKGLDPDLRNRLFIGLEMGNRWYIKPQEKFGIGIMVDWFDITMPFLEVDPPKEFSNNQMYIFNASIFELGPIVTFAINPDLGIDAYYNLRPTYMNMGIYLDEDWETGEGYDAEDQTAMGFSHTCGVALRLKSFALSFEYLLGNIKTTDGLTFSNGDWDINFNSTTLSSNHFRIMLGFKF